MTYEERVINFVRGCSLLEILCIEIDRFSTKHRSKPEIVIFSSDLRKTFLAEIMISLAIPAGMVPIDPVWISGIPIVFRKMPEVFMILKNSALGIETTL